MKVCCSLLLPLLLAYLQPRNLSNPTYFRAQTHTRVRAYTYKHTHTHTHKPAHTHSHPPSLVSGDITKIEELDAARESIDEAEKKKSKTPMPAQSSDKKEVTDYPPKPGLRFKKKLWTGADLGMGNIPAAFDWRNAKSTGTKCRDQINQVYTQGHCGSW